MSISVCTQDTCNYNALTDLLTKYAFIEFHSFRIYVYSQEREERDGCGSVPLTIELRPTHSQKKIYLGFMLPVDQVRTSCLKMRFSLCMD